MQVSNPVITKLTNIFNSLFCKDSLRRNLYIFNSMSENMELSIKTVAKQRRVAQITNNTDDIIEALKHCPYVEILSHHLLRIIMKGDEVVVKIVRLDGKKVGKKDVQSLTKQMRCDIKDGRDHFLIEFQSHAATVEFVERIKLLSNQYSYEILEKSAYKCLQQSLSNYRKQKKVSHQSKNQAQYTQQLYPQNYMAYDYSQYYGEQYQVFIRRAVPSDDEQEQQERSKKNISKKYVEKSKPEAQIQRPRFNSQDFPSFEKLSINTQKKQQG